MSLAPLRRSGWVMADYAVSAATNVLVTLTVARQVTGAEFGSFALLYGYYVLVLELSRAAFSEPLLIRLPARADQGRRRLGDSAGSAAVFGVLAAVALVPLAATVLGGLGVSALTIAVSLPGLLVQDALRVGFVALGQGRKALLNDLFWGVSQCAALGLLTLLGVGSAALGAWAGAGLAAAGLGLLQARAVPRVGALRGWMRDYGRLARPYVAEVATIAIATYAGMLTVGVVAGTAAVGALRAGTTMLGPVGLVCAAGRTVAISECSRIVAHAPCRLERMMLVLGACLTAAVGCWGLVTVSLPASVGRELVGASWPGARAVLPALIVVQLMSAIVVTFGGAMRALEAIRAQLALRVLGGILTFLGLAVGATWQGAVGGAVGLAAVNVAGCAITAVVFLRLRARILRAGRRYPRGSALSSTGVRLADGTEVS
jgi:hypothetical protein